MNKDAHTIVWEDYLVIGIHFLLTVAVGLWAARSGSKGTAKGYFLAGRSMSWYLVGASLYVSNIGSSSFMGIGGAASANGIAVVCYEFTGLFIIQLLGFVFVPVYLAAGVYTTPEYIRRRFGGRRCNIYLSIQSLIMFILTKLSTEIYAGALIIQFMLGWDKYLSVLLLLGCTALYTIVGGLKSVIYTDALQTIVILVGGTILSVMSIIKINGYEEMMRKFPAAVSPEALIRNDSCGMPPSHFGHIFREVSDPDYPWPGVVFGATILSYWYFCTDQVLVQRLLSAKNTVHAKGGSVLAGYLKILPLFLMAWPGIIARILYPETVACTSGADCEKVCGIQQGCSNFAYIAMVQGVMPTGLRGLMLAAMLAALMSSLTSIFNSGSTVFTLDLYKMVRKSASERELMLVGRLFVLFFVGVSIAWLPMIDRGQGGQLFNYLQSITSYLAPPVGAVFLMGVFSKRANEQGAFWALLVGFVLGMARMISDFLLPSPSCGELDTRPWIVAGVHYLHFAIFLFGISIAVMVAVSFLSAPPDETLLYRTTWWTKEQYNPLWEPPIETPKDTDNEPIVIKGESEPKPDVQTPSTSPRATQIRQCLLSWFCGEENLKEPPETEAVTRRLAILSTKESKLSRMLVNLNLALVLVAGVFIWAFFA